MDELLTELAEAGWLITNAYQHDDGEWRVNIRRPVEGGDIFSEWAEGPSLRIALETALERADQHEFHEEREVNYALDKTKATDAGKNLLAQLGLAKPEVKIQRRF